MKILLINKFFYNRGGAERWLFEVDRFLRDQGHETVYFSMRDDNNVPSPWNEYFVSPVSYTQSPFSPASLKAILRMFYSGEVNRAIERLIKDTRPDIALLGNVYHQLGPSLIHSLARHRIPMIMMLHDYKVVCPSYLMFRRGRPCEKCARGRFFWSAIHGCGGSRVRGCVLALESYWQKNIVKSYSKIATFIAPSRFLADNANEMGFTHPIQHVPNFVSIPTCKADTANGRAVGFAGRISPEKGLRILINAAAMATDIPVRIAGTGPSLEELKQLASPNVTFVGQLDKESLVQEMLTWRAAVIPSLWYENSPYSILEAMALGLPVIGSDAGGISELLNGRGILFPAADAKALARAIHELWGNLKRCKQLGDTGREFIRIQHSKEKFISVLLPVLEKTLSTARGKVVSQA